jgi:small-conductance mechanosensitive channel
MDFSRPFLAHLAAATAAIPLLFPLLLWIGRVLKYRLRVPFGLRYRLFAAAFSGWLPLRVYAWWVTRPVPGAAKGPADVQRVGEPQPLEAFQVPEELLRILLAVSVFCAALVLVKVIRKHLWDDWYERTQDTEAPKFVGDICSAAVVGASLLLIAWGVYDSNLKVFELSSTVSVAVLGFASQDLLGNLLAGIALQISSPFRKGDWLLLDHRRLQVQEVNWRSTRMRSSDNVLVDVPNKTIAGGIITNLSAPTPERAATVTVPVGYAVSPNRVKEALLQAATGTPGVLPSPSPKVTVRDFGENAVLYDVTVWVEAEEHQTEVADRLRVRIWEAAGDQGFALHAVRPAGT